MSGPVIYLVVAKSVIYLVVAESVIYLHHKFFLLKVHSIHFCIYSSLNQTNIGSIEMHYSRLDVLSLLFCSFIYVIKIQMLFIQLFHAMLNNVTHLVCSLPFFLRSFRRTLRYGQNLHICFSFGKWYFNENPISNKCLMTRVQE